MNGLNESDVTKVTCVTNVTNVTCVTNEFDETRFLSFVQSDSSAIFAGVSHSRLTFPPAIPPPRKNRTEKRKKSGANAPLQNGLTVFKEYFRGCCVRQTIRVSLKANAYCSVLPVSERVRGLSSLT